MSDKRYLGNIITPNPTEPAGPFQDSAASGVWSLGEAFTYTKAGLWPTAGNVEPTALFAGGYTTTYTNTITTFNITIVGATFSDFGDLASNTGQWGISGNATRAIFGATGSVSVDYTNTISYINYSTLGNSSDFGDLTISKSQGATVANPTRAVFGLGFIPSPFATNVLDYVTIASTGNAIDFGDATQARNSSTASAGSSTRGIFAGGFSPFSSANINVMDYITIASAGNAIDFGDLGAADGQNTGVSSGTRAVFTAGTDNRPMRYVTIATTGNTTDFGDLSEVGDYLSSSCSTTRGVFYGGGIAVPANAMEYITIASTGNGTDFGDLPEPRIEHGGTSRVHGGLA